VEALAADELRAAAAKVTETLSGFDRRESLLLFEAPDIRRALRSTLLEDIYRVLVDVPLPRTRNVPAALSRALTREALDAALPEHHALASRRRGRSYRVVVRVAGKQPFRREDVEASFGRAVGSLLPHWVWTREKAAVEVWVQIIGERAIIGLRLTDDAFGQRRYKRAHLPASLKPTVARALVAWSAPRPDDVVLDPMAGAGTILRERADASPATLVAGGDLDAEAVAAASANAGRQTSVLRWDAARLPVRNACIDAIITNPPYGRQHEAVQGIDKLYRAMLAEAARVLRHGGRAVVLTGEPAVLGRVMPASFRTRATHRLLLRGLPVTAFVLERK
jgi:tRNA G10  N-methylase Trm11